MSIYVSISTLEDGEIGNTAIEAVLRADRPDDITVGIAFHTTRSFYERFVHGFKHQELDDRIKSMHFNRDDKRNIGIGIGRKHALLGYSGQDIVVQVDAHTSFDYSWDTQITTLYDLAIKETQNEKTIITGFPGSYITNRFHDREVVNSEMRYCVWSNEPVHGANPMQRWKDVPLRLFPKTMIPPDRMFFPANKVSGAMIVGNSHFVESDSLPRNVVFFEEEIIQTINLLDKGFSLVYPHVMMPITHYYQNTMPSHYVRQTVFNEFLYEDDAISGAMQANYYDFINNPSNAEKCRRYEEWSGFSLDMGFSKPYFIPKSYNY